MWHFAERKIALKFLEVDDYYRCIVLKRTSSHLSKLKT